MTKGIYVGIDVSKDFLDIAFSSNKKPIRVSNDKNGINKLLRALSNLDKVEMVVLEPSGGYEKDISISLHKKGFSIVRANPYSVRNFAKAANILAKTDEIDAKVLVKYGQTMEPKLWMPKSEEVQKLSVFVKRRNQIVEMITQEKNRLQNVDRYSRDMIISTISFLDKQRKEVESIIKSIVNKYKGLKEIYAILVSEYGIGFVTATMLMAELPELGKLEHKQLNSLVGVAPFNYDSGMMLGQKKIYGGRKVVRTALYMAITSAIKGHLSVSPFYQKLRNKGKIHKVAAVAAMRKMLNILNAKLRIYYSSKQDVDGNIIKLAA